MRRIAMWPPGGLRLGWVIFDLDLDMCLCLDEVVEWVVEWGGVMEI
jgi:hypothetical protein